MNKDFFTNEPLPIGKLDSQLLEKIVFDKLHYRREEVVTRSGIGEDCAVIDYGQYDCVISTDPISAAVNDIGKLAINISCNDIASNGVEPVGITLVLMLPFGTTAEDIDKIMGDAHEMAAALNVEIVGGHTEITDAVNQPVVVSTAFGRSAKNHQYNSSSIKAGDVILMTKKAGLEGTGIICSDLKEKVSGILTDEEVAKGIAFLDDTSVVKEGVAAGNIGVSAMHDVTEGGILGAIWEMSQVAKVGATIYKDNILVDDITLKVAGIFDIDYLKLISSGAMIIVAEEVKAMEIADSIKALGIEVSEIGRITDISEGVNIVEDNQLKPIEPPEADHLYKAFK